MSKLGERSQNLPHFRSGGQLVTTFKPINTNFTYSDILKKTANDQTLCFRMSVDKAYVIAQMGELHKNRDDADFTLTSSNGEVIKAHSYILSMRWVN